MPNLDKYIGLSKPAKIVFDLTFDEFENIINDMLTKDSGGVICNAELSIDGDTGFVAIEVDFDEMSDEDYDNCRRAGYNLQEAYELSNKILGRLFKTDELLAPYTDPDENTDYLSIEMSYNTFTNYMNLTPIKDV